MQELKVYGHIYPAGEAFEKELATLLNQAIPDTISADIPLLEREGDMLRISFEGRYFPEEDIIALIEEELTPEQQGKIDVLDMLAWHMTRYLFQKGEVIRREASLNHVLDYSGF